mmetsp:Transcript_9387/g.21427  ORF Transcript_9387/g.21427 Transcript_9387/m.21427 type:complete len:122 (+) Transcript_9387:619-984(+)
MRKVQPVSVLNSVVVGECFPATMFNFGSNDYRRAILSTYPVLFPHPSTAAWPGGRSLRLTLVEAFAQVKPPLVRQCNRWTSGPPCCTSESDAHPAGPPPSAIATGRFSRIFLNFLNFPEFS